MKQTIDYPNGDKYEGEVKNGLPAGKGKLFLNLGTYIFSNNDKYEGEWKDGEMNGEG